MQDGSDTVTSNDVLANVPSIHGCGRSFDHHASDAERLGQQQDVRGTYAWHPAVLA